MRQFYSGALALELSKEILQAGIDKPDLGQCRSHRFLLFEERVQQLAARIGSHSGSTQIAIPPFTPTRALWLRLEARTKSRNKHISSSRRASRFESGTKVMVPNAKQCGYTSSDGDGDR